MPGSTMSSRAGPEPTLALGLLWRVGRALSRVLFLLVFRGRVFGLRHVPRSGGALVVSNHQSYLDPMFVALSFERECCFMARDSLFHNRLFGGLLKRVNAIPLKRGTADLGAVKTSLRNLEAGNMLVVFPESTRSADGAIGEMQHGVVMLARRARVPIVPALIVGAFKAWPRHARLPRPRPILVAYGEPILPAQTKGLDNAACIRLVRERLIELAHRYGGPSPKAAPR